MTRSPSKRGAAGRAVLAAVLAAAALAAGPLPHSGAAGRKASTPTLPLDRAPAPGPGQAGPPSSQLTTFGYRVPVFDRPPPPGARRALAAQGKAGRVAARAALAPAPQGQASAAATAPLTVTGAGSTFSVTLNGFTPQAAGAFRSAIQTWADLVYSPVPITISAAWVDFHQPNTLGAAGPDKFVPSAGGAVLYPIALGNDLAGRDLDPSTPDIDAEFNSGYAAWSFDGQPGPGEEDLQSVIRHEIGHGLGFISSFSAGANGDPSGCPAGHGCFGTDTSAATAPFAFDRYIYYGPSGSTSLLSLGNDTAGLYDAETSGNVYWAGPHGVARAGMKRPKLYFPGSWSPGSSGSHLDESAYPASSGNGLMTPYINPGEVEPVPGPIVVGMMTDIGWPTPAAQNSSFIRAAYQDFLGRPAPNAEVAFFMPSLGGLSRYQVAYSLTTTPEWLDAIFKALYLNTLRRAPSRAELDWWEGEVRAGRQTITSASAFFYASDEYFRTQAGGDLSRWVNQLYQAILGRAPTGQDVDYWSGVAVTWGRGVAAYQIYQSTESRQGRVKALYSKLLGRDPDPRGFAYWTGALVSQDDLNLAANLAGSFEYLLRSEARYP